MANDESESLDFTEKEPAKPAPKPASRRKAVRTSEPEKPASARKVGLPVLIIGALIVGIVLMTANHSSKEVVAPPPSAKPPTPVPAAKAPQMFTPPPKGATAPPKAPPPPPPVAAQSGSTRAVPTDFLATFQEYNKRSGAKAIALALDADGRWAFGTVSAFAKESDAREEALSECAIHKAKSEIKANCRLFAVGDKIVW